MIQDTGKPKVVGIIMTYNCAGLVEDIYNRLPKDVFDAIIIVDDGSMDTIAAVAEKLHTPLFPHEHLGYGGNIKYSLKKAVELGGDCIVEIHGDGQFDPQYIPAGVEKMKEGYDFIMGSRFTDLLQPLKDGMPLSRYLANISLSFIDWLILQAPVGEYHGGLRFYSKRLVKTINLDAASDDYLFGFEVIAQARFHYLKIGEVPARADYKKTHTSISIPRAVFYSFQTFWILGKYILARLGFKIKIFE